MEKYSVMASQREITINNYLRDEQIYIGRTALKVVLSNLVSNAIKYSDAAGCINIGACDGWLYIENSYENAEQLDCDKLFEVNFDLGKENSSGLGLYIVRNILLSYGIEHKLECREKSVAFMIKMTTLK